MSYDCILLETVKEGRKLLSSDKVAEARYLLQAEVVRQASRQDYFNWVKKQSGRLNNC